MSRDDVAARRSAARWMRVYQFLWGLGGCAIVVLLFFGVQRATRSARTQHVVAHWTTDTMLPWGEPSKRDMGQPTVTLFYQTGRGYCFDSIFSEQVRQALIASQRTTVEVNYRVFHFRGKYVGYEIASVADIPFKTGQPPDKDGWAEGGNVTNNCHS